MKIFLNGKFVEKEEAKISVFDHGLLYGDGVFEGIRLYQGCLFKLDEHLERLEFSAKALRLALPWDREYLAESTCEACRQNNLTDGYIRMLVTRGEGTLGLSPLSCKHPQLIIIADKIQLYPESFYKDGLKIITSATRRINAAALPPMVKSLNYLNNILAKMEAQLVGFHEAVMLNDQGYVAECTGDNLFVLTRGKLITPDISSGALRGITREVVMDIAGELGIPMVIENLTRYDIWNAEECFLTGTAAELIPAVELDGRVIGTGSPGPVTARFLERFRERACREGRML